MSRKGKHPIVVPKGVEVKVAAQHISVKGPKGTLARDVLEGIDVAVENEQIVVSMAEDNQGRSNFHGLFRSLIANMVTGVTQGYTKRLEMIGVGYRALVQGHKLVLQIGVSHPVELPIPHGLTIEVKNNSQIVINGIDNQLVGQFAAIVRSKRPPEPYQGKGIRYEGEYVRKKAGKAAAKK